MSFRSIDSISKIICPGQWLVGSDRDLASQEQMILDHICDALDEAFISAKEFIKILKKEEKLSLEERLNASDSCKKQIFSKSFVYSIDSICKQLKTLDPAIGNESEKEKICDLFKNEFGYLRHIRDSSMHIEARGIGLDKNMKPLKTKVIVLGSFINNCFSFSGSDGKHYQIEISKQIADKAKEIIQKLLDSYEWQ
jgi:hypothetical protein